MFVFAILSSGCADETAAGLYERSSYRRPLNSIADRSVPRSIRLASGGDAVVTHASGESENASYRVRGDTLWFFDEPQSALPVAYALWRADTLFLFVPLVEGDGLRNPVIFARVATARP